MSIYDDKLILIYFCVLSLIVGAVLGSFLNCAAWRIAHGESFVSGHSRCTSCGHELAPVDLIPVVSWLMLHGKCRYCGAPVSKRYIAAELAFAAITLITLLRFDLTPIMLRNLVFTACLFCLSIVDLESFTVPNGTLIIAATAWLIAAPFTGMSATEMLRHLSAGFTVGAVLLVISLVMDVLLKKESLGGGDIKLFAVTGLYEGFAGALFGVFISCLLGLMLAALYAKLPHDEEGHFPFGPAIAASAFIMLICGEQLVNWYLGLIF